MNSYQRTNVVFIIQCLKYRIANLKGESKDIKILLSQYDLEEDKDYLLGNVSEQFSSGVKYKNEYYLHPRAFKLCLMQSKNTKIYAKYYLLLERVYQVF